MGTISDIEAIEFASKYLVCDSHDHIYPEKIAEKAVESIGDFYHIPMTFRKGVSDELIESGKRVGVKKYVVCSVATDPKQVVSINNFIKAECDLHPEFIGLGSLHPDLVDIESEVERIISLGLKGIKIHPDFQKFNIDDENALKIYSAIEGKLPILIHMGDSRYDFSSPKRLERIIKLFPNLKVIAAHLGGYQRWEEASKCEFTKNVYFDTSSSLDFIDTDFAKKIVMHYGTDNVFFGTDFPMWSHVNEIKNIMSLELSDEDNKKILGENLLAFFQIKK